MSQVRPSLEDGENVRIEGSSRGVTAKNVIDANVKTFGLDESWAPLRRALVQSAGLVIFDRSCEESHLKVDDFTLLLRREVGDRLRMTARCSVRLIQQIEVDRLIVEGFPSVPHHGGEEFQIC